MSGLENRSYPIDGGSLYAVCRALQPGTKGSIKWRDMK